MIVVKMAMRIAIIITIPMIPTTTPKSSPLIVNWLVAVINRDFMNHVLQICVNRKQVLTEYVICYEKRDNLRLSV